MKIVYTFFIGLLMLLNSLQRAAAQGFPLIPLYTGAPQAILADQDRHIVLLGKSMGFCLHKYDTLGNLIWARLQWADTAVPHGSGQAANLLEATDMVITNDTGYLICGDSCWSSVATSGPNFRFITKFDKNGNRLWTHYDSTGPNSSGWPAFMRPVQNKSAFVVSDFYRMLKYDSLGNLVAQSLPGTDTTQVEAMDNFNDTAVITISLHTSYSSILYDTLLNPRVLETHNYNAHPHYLAATPQGGYIVTGQLFLPAATQSSSSPMLEKYTAGGYREWTKYYHKDTLGMGNHVLQTGNYYIISGMSKVCRNTDSPLSVCYGFSNMLLIKIDTAGNELAYTYISSYDTAVLDTNYSYVANRSLALGNYLYTYGTKTQMYLQPNALHGVIEHTMLGIAIVWRTNLDSFGTPVEVFRATENAPDDLLVFPNPGNKEMLVQSLSGMKINQLYIYDLSGKTPAADIKIEGDRAVLNTAKLPTGTYFLRVWTEKGVMHKKIIVAGW